MHYQTLSNIISSCWSLTLLLIIASKWKMLSLSTKTKVGVYAIAKLFAVFFFIWLYTNYYKTGDYYFYRNCLENETIASGNFRTKVFLKIIELVYFFSFKNYIITNINLSILATISSLCVLKTLTKRFSDYLLLFLPTLLLWTSGVTKETLILIAINFGIYHTVLFLESPKTRFLVISICCAIVTIIVKPYIGIPLVFLLIFKIIRQQYPSLIKPYLLLTFSIVAITIGLYHQFLYEVLYISHQLIAEKSKDLLSFPFYSSWSDQLFSLPLAFYKGLFGPLFFQHNLFVNALFMLQAIMISVLLLTPQQRKRSILVEVTVLLLLILLIAIVTPNWGTLTRYSSIPIYLLLYFYSFKLKNEVPK